jgi:kinesin family member C2/C3
VLLPLPGNIRVFARVRPQFDADAVAVMPTASSTGVLVSDSTRSVDGRESTREKEFRFDHVFGESSTQGEVYGEVEPLVRSVMDGFNVCVFAYGQTGAGKTFTMQGTPEQPGVNVRAIRDLFRLADSRSDTMEYEVRLSMMEIYNERIRDLLADGGPASGSGSSSSAGLEVRRGEHGVYVEGLTRVAVDSEVAVDRMVLEGNARRSTASTGMNDVSSRSHMVLNVHVCSTNKVGCVPAACPCPCFTSSDLRLCNSTVPFFRPSL